MTTRDIIAAASGTDRQDMIDAAAGDLVERLATVADVDYAISHLEAVRQAWMLEDES